MKAQLFKLMQRVDNKLIGNDFWTSASKGMFHIRIKPVDENSTTYTAFCLSMDAEKAAQLHKHLTHYLNTPELHNSRFDE